MPPSGLAASAARMHRAHFGACGISPTTSAIRGTRRGGGLARPAAGGAPGARSLRPRRAHDRAHAPRRRSAGVPRGAHGNLPCGVQAVTRPLGRFAPALSGYVRPLCEPRSSRDRARLPQPGGARSVAAGTCRVDTLSRRGRARVGRARRILTRAAALKARGSDQEPARAFVIFGEAASIANPETRGRGRSGAGPPTWVVDSHRAYTARVRSS